MKVRRVAVVVLTIFLSIQVVPIAAAAPRDRDDFPTRIVRAIQNLQRFFGLSPFDSSVIPPHP